MKNKFSLNTDLHIETILLSVTDDNYQQLIEQLSQSIEAYDYDLSKKLEKFLWLANTQLQGHVPNVQTLKKEFPEMIFDDQEVIQTQDELTDYIHFYSTQKQQRYISGKLGKIADTVRSQGLSESLIEEIYQCTAMGEAESTYESIVDVYEEQYTQQVKLQGISFLCPELDKLTGGIAPGQICTVLGAPGSMKTTYTANIAFNAAKQGKNILYLSLEEAPMQLYSKWLSRSSVELGKPIQSQDIIQKKLEEKDEKIFFEQVIPYAKGLPGKLYIVGEQDLANYQLTTLEAKFKEIDKRAIEETGHGIDLLVVDHIQLLKFAEAGYSEFTVINMYVSFLRQQSLSWLHNKREISVIILSQANREGIDYAQKHDGMYKLQHVAEASEVERASAYIISVYTDAMVQITKQLKVGAVKLRGSQLPTSTITVYADGAFYQVGDTAIPEQMDYSSDIIMGDEFTQHNTYSEEDLFASGILTAIQ